MTRGSGRCGTCRTPHKPGITDQLNQSMASLVHGQLRKHRVQVVIGCTTHPDDPHRADIKRAISRYGARVLKLHCSVGDFAADDPGLDEVYGIAAKSQIPVVIHAGRPITGRTAAADLEPLGRAVDQHPDTTFVLAHTGHPNHRAALDLMHRHDNLWSDITPVLDELMPASVEEIEAVHDRLLFGSDAPNTTLRVQDVDAWLSSLGLREASLEAIRSGNAGRLLDRAHEANRYNY